MILVILLAASVPRLAPAAQRLRTEQAALDLAQWLRIARERAVAESQAFIWRWDADTRRVRLESAEEDEAAADEGTAAGSDRLPAQSPPVSADLAVTILQDGRPAACRCVRFLPDGTSESATVTVDSPAARYVITIHEATGHVVLAAGSAAD